MPISGYFDIPFASSGTKTAIPETVQVDGSVSYPAGYGTYYTQDPAVYPTTALNIEEDKFNQLMYDITAAIQYLQQNGCGPFITSTMNGGSPYSYPKGAVVIKSGVFYQSLVAANTDTPPTANWQVFDLGLFALLASPTFTGTPSAPTAAPGTNTTQIATTAFVQASSKPQIQPISASVAANALTVSASALSLDFRSTTLGSGTVTTVSGTPSNLVVPSGATLGTINAVKSRIAVLVLNNAGTLELAVVNLSGGNDLSETGLISTTAITSGATAKNVVYSTTARSSVAYRVVGYVESTQSTAGTWATAPSTIQGAGGEAATAMSSIGYGQTWQDVTGSRALSTTYYNTTGKPIMISVQVAINAGNTATASVGGVTLWQQFAQTNSTHATATLIVPPGAPYSVASSGLDAWTELS